MEPLDAIKMGFVDKGLLENLGTNLWEKRAAVMIGAGFSCNAVPNSAQSSPMLIWAELVGELQRELGNTKESNVLSLADMYEATFGRNQLDRFLATHLPDMSYTPGSLHKQLLNLPWRDVFTTNYDTLLERASAAMLNHYDIVRQKEDIPLTKPPRIVKLHGTFGMARPLVFTGEDYRQYPQQSAAFANLVQQSMLENVFCLLGFSGDDINFLKWMGWIRDNLGDYHQPIYICGILNVDNAKRNVWQKRGIVPIDLAPAFPKKNWPDAGERHKRALEWLLDNLMEMKPAEPKDWAAPTSKKPRKPRPLVPRLVIHESGNTNNQIPIFQEYDNKKKVRRLCKQIEELRKSYPGWIVAPQSVRCRISDMWRGIWHIQSLKVNSLPLLIDLAYEYDWAMRMALQNLSCSHNRYLTKIVGKVKDCRALDVEHREKWLCLVLSLIRYSRVTNDKVNFDKYSSLAVDYLPKYGELRHKYTYEHVMQAVQQDDFQSIENFLKDWFIDEEDSLWNLKKAAVLAETGYEESVRRYVENFIRIIKSKISTANEDDIYLYSAYGWALYLYSIIGVAHVNAEDYIIYDIKEELDKIREHGEDPRQRMQELFDIEMSEEDSFGERIENGFDSNRISIMTHLVDRELDDGLAQVASFFEEAPVPVRFGYQMIFPMKAKVFLKSRTASLSNFYWPIAGRLKDYDRIVSWMTPMRILKMTDEEVTCHWQRISKTLKMLYLHNGKFRIDKQEEMLRINMELSSRLAFRLKDNQFKELLELLIDIYEHSDLVKKNISLMRELDVLFERVLQALKPPMIFEYALKFAELPLNKKYWLEPMSHMININIEIAKKHISEEILSTFTHTIDILLQKLLERDSDIRRCASIRLLFFYELGAMSKEQRDTYAKNLWSKIDQKTKLPNNTGMYPEQLLLLLIDLEPEKKRMLEEYISNHDFFENGDSFGRISETEHPIAKYVRVCLNSVQPLLTDENKTDKNYLLWNEEAAEKYLIKAISAWVEFKKFFISRGCSVIFHRHFVNAIIRFYIRGLNRLVLPYADADKNTIGRQAKELLDDMASSGVSIINALPGKLYLDEDNAEGKAKDLEQKVLGNLGSSDSQIVSCTMEAVLVWMAYESGDVVKKLEAHMSDDFIEGLLERSMYLRAGCFIEVMAGLSAILRYKHLFGKKFNKQMLKELLQHGQYEAENLEEMETRLQSEPGCSYRRFVSEMVKAALLIKEEYQGEYDDLDEILKYWTEDFPKKCPLPEVWRLLC